jgi:DNA-directed RNA polymerase specialized sigma24 family protein
VPDFDTVYREQRPVVHRWVAWRYNETLADDVVQEAFLQAWLKWDQIEAVENIRRWLIGIAKYVARHMVRATGALSRGGAAITIPRRQTLMSGLTQHHRNSPCTWHSCATTSAALGQRSVKR